MEKNTPEYRRPQVQRVPVEDLKVARWLEAMPRMSADDPDYLRMQRSWELMGDVPPIAITPDRQIVDGRHRFWWAKAHGLESLAAYQVSEEEGRMTAITSVTGRKHLTKGQRAYLLYPFFKGAHDEVRTVFLDRIKNGGKTRVYSVHSAPDASSLAEQIGVSRQLFFHAAKVHALFAKDPEYQAEMEPKILANDSPVGLGAVIAGHAGREATQGRAKTERPSQELFSEGFKLLVLRALKVRDAEAMGTIIEEVVNEVIEVDDAIVLGELGDLLKEHADLRRFELGKSKAHKPATE